MIPDSVRAAFGLRGPIRCLPGSSRPAYRVGNVVVGRLRIRSLETQHSLELAPWLAGRFACVEEQGFRLARPVATLDGGWMPDDGWAEWAFVAGRPVRREDVPEAIAAIQALHTALRHVEKHPLLDRNTTAWGFAHRHCWDRPPERVHPLLLIVSESAGVQDWESASEKRAAELVLEVGSRVAFET